MLKKIKIIKKNKYYFFLKHCFYQNALKKNNKRYFLLDFFKGFKGSFALASAKKKKYIGYIYKSFSKLKEFKNINNFDYFFKSPSKFISYNELKLSGSKNKDSIFLTFFIKHINFYLARFNSAWLLNFFLGLKKNYIQSLSFKLLINFNYLSYYYDFIKSNLIYRFFIIFKECKLLKFNFSLSHMRFALLNKFNIFLNNYNILNNIFLFSKYNKYNNFKNYKITLISSIFKKLNRFFSSFKFLLKKKRWHRHSLKWFFTKLIYRLKYNNLGLLNPFIFSLLSKKVKIKNKASFLFSNLKKKKVLKLHFFLNYFYRAFVNQRLNYAAGKSIVLQYYFYFYNFIIKIFIKLFYSFKFLIFSKNNIVIKKIIWFKILLIFLYYKKIIINGKKLKKRKAYNKLIKNFKYKSLRLTNKLLNLKLKFYIKGLPEWKKKFVTGRMQKFSKNLNLRLSLIRQIKLYKKGSYFYFLRVKKLKQIYARLVLKIKKMQSFQKNRSLKMFKLMKFIKNNKLKRYSIFRVVGVGDRNS